MQNTKAKQVKAWIERMASGRRGVLGVAVAGFLESSFIPFPLEALLVPAFHLARSRAWILASAALVGCLLAAIIFYFIGAVLQDTFINRIAEYLDITAGLDTFYSRLKAEGFWVIFAISLLPAPIQIATLGSGAADYPFALFVLAIFSSRLIRFYGLAALTLVLGDKIEHAFQHIPRYLGWVISVFVFISMILFLFL